nr:MAG TPA_asm: hypothetical protein [Bacteriophage sp.]
MNKYKGKLAHLIGKNGQIKPLWLYITDAHYPYCNCICARGKKYLRNVTMNATLVSTKDLIVAETFCLTVSRQLLEKFRVGTINTADFPFELRCGRMLKRFRDLKGKPAIMRLNAGTEEILCFPIKNINTHTYMYSLETVIRITLGECICTI